MAIKNEHKSLDFINCRNLCCAKPKAAKNRWLQFENENTHQHRKISSGKQSHKKSKTGILTPS